MKDKDIKEQKRIFPWHIVAGFIFALRVVLIITGDSYTWAAFETVSYGLLAIGMLIRNKTLLVIGSCLKLVYSVVVVTAAYAIVQLLESVEMYKIYLLISVFALAIVIWFFFLITALKGPKAKYCGIISSISSGLFAVIVSFALGEELMESLPTDDLLYIMEFIGIIFANIALCTPVQTNLPNNQDMEHSIPSEQFENLAKIKELLDSGAITQEEFEEMKKNCLAKMK